MTLTCTSGEFGPCFNLLEPEIISAKEITLILQKVEAGSALHSLNP